VARLEATTTERQHVLARQRHAARLADTHRVADAVALDHLFREVDPILGVDCVRILGEQPKRRVEKTALDIAPGDEHPRLHRLRGAGLWNRGRERREDLEDAIGGDGITPWRWRRVLRGERGA